MQAIGKLRRNLEACEAKTSKALKYFDMLLPLLERLHGEACGRDKAKNRELHFDKYCMLVLLYMFNRCQRKVPT